MMEEMLKKIMNNTTRDLITDKYINGDETIEQLKTNFKKTFKNIDEIEDNFAEQIGFITNKIEIFSDIMCMKKLKDNREDALKLVGLLEELTEELKRVIKEVEIND